MDVTGVNGIGGSEVGLMAGCLPVAGGLWGGALGRQDRGGVGGGGVEV